MTCVGPNETSINVVGCSNAVRNPAVPMTKRGVPQKPAIPTIQAKAKAIARPHTAHVRSSSSQDGCRLVMRTATAIKMKEQAGPESRKATDVDKEGPQHEEHHRSFSQKKGEKAVVQGSLVCNGR